MAFGASIALQVAAVVEADAETATTTLVDNRPAKAATAVTARPIDAVELALRMKNVPPERS